MKKIKIPKTDSIKELAKFFDTHDSTDFEDELVEVTEPLFVPRNSVLVRLEPRQAAALKKLAAESGVSAEQLLHQWVEQGITGVNGRGAKQRAVLRGPNTGIELMRWRTEAAWQPARIGTAEFAKRVFQG